MQPAAFSSLCRCVHTYKGLALTSCKNERGHHVSGCKHGSTAGLGLQAGNTQLPLTVGRLVGKEGRQNGGTRITRRVRLLHNAWRMGRGELLQKGRKGTRTRRSAAFSPVPAG